MTAPFPHRYETSLAWSGESSASLGAGPPRPQIAGGPPPEFGGAPDRWSPEHLLLASANLCLMTTFMAVARKSGLEVLGYESSAVGVLDKTPEGLVFTEIKLLVRLRVLSGRTERAGRALELSKKHCIVSNALRKPPVVELELFEGAAA